MSKTENRVKIKNITLGPKTRQTPMMLDDILEAPIMAPGHPSQSKGLNVFLHALWRLHIHCSPYHWACYIVTSFVHPSIPTVDSSLNDKKYALIYQ